MRDLRARLQCPHIAAAPRSGIICSLRAKRAHYKKFQIYNCAPAPGPKGAIISGITLGTSAGCVWLSRASRLTVQWVKHMPSGLLYAEEWGTVCERTLSHGLSSVRTQLQLRGVRFTFGRVNVFGWQRRHAALWPSSAFLEQDNNVSPSPFNNVQP